MIGEPWRYIGPTQRGIQISWEPVDVDTARLTATMGELGSWSWIVTDAVNVALSDLLTEGLWCPQCEQPARNRVTFHALTEDGVSPIGQLEVCVGCRTVRAEHWEEQP